MLKYIPVYPAKGGETMTEPSNPPEKLDDKSRNAITTIIDGALKTAVQEALARGDAPDALRRTIDERVAALRAQL
jgi:hypothetical protein